MKNAALFVAGIFLTVMVFIVAGIDCSRNKDIVIDQKQEIAYLHLYSNNLLGKIDTLTKQDSLHLKFISKLTENDKKILRRIMLADNNQLDSIITAYLNKRK